MVIGGILTRLFGLVAPGAIAAVGSLPPIWIIVTGRGNPWWMRSPLDRPAGDDVTGRSQVQDATPARASTGVSQHRATGVSQHRAKYGLVSVLSLGFVVAGIALIVIGASTHRWDRVFVGALGCFFFGACAWIGLSLLRRSV
jgi:hypothetical protein